MTMEPKDANENIHWSLTLFCPAGPQALDMYHGVYENPFKQKILNERTMLTTKKILSISLRRAQFGCLYEDFETVFCKKFNQPAECLEHLKEEHASSYQLTSPKADTGPVT